MASPLTTLVPTRRYKGPSLLPPNVPDSAIDALETFEYRNDDILIAAYPKSGTHWINEVIQLILHKGDPAQLDYRHRRVCLELKDTHDFSKLGKVTSTIELVKTDPSPRVLMTHLGPSYLSKDTWTKRIPIVCILRDPRDVVISMYNFSKDFKSLESKPVGDDYTFDALLETFVSDEAIYGNWCDHALGYERLAAKGENILIISYEDMKKDMTAAVKSIASHIGHEVTAEVIAKVVTNSAIDAMRKNYQEASKTQDNVAVNFSSFIKTGTAGRWKTEVPEDKWKKLNENFKEKVKDTVFAKRYFPD
ncbi:Sulfotransferase family cytosolic 1B member 1 [Holothuria leucospilota]|uniref:Sulfotransferase family cytosolic 1B member 1 n=1 Tax=Holothuria leucospilota TaxID=206669 RepID=A0A9Q1BRW6_HOLLE|nr:Sulfotransferase family cytosolic 1B member 1 [Holothuria leucospilota]